MHYPIKISIALLLIIAMLSACGPAATETAPPTELPPPTSTPVPPPTATPLPPPDPWGDVVVPRGESIQVAFVGMLSGPLPEVGTAMLTAAEMAVKDYGPFQDFSVEIVPFDDMCSGEQAKITKDEVLANPQLVGVVGFSCSSPTATQLPHYEAAHLPVVASAVSASGLDQYAPSVWNSTMITDQQAEATGDAFDITALPEYAVFAAAYEANMGEPLGKYGAMAATTYDATMLLLQAIDQVAWQDPEGGLVIGRQALNDVLRATSAYLGASGYISLDESGMRIPPVSPDSWGEVVVPAGEKIELAFFLPTTEPYNIYAPAAEYATAQFGPVKGFDVKLTVVDDFCFESGIASPAEEIVNRPEVAGVVGPLCSPATLAALPYFEQAHMVMVTYGATRQDLNAYGKNVFNRVILNNQQVSTTTYENEVYFFMEAEVQQWLSEFTAWANIPIQDMNPDTWPFYPLTYDATGVLLTAIDQVAQIAPDGSLVTGRQALAEAVRATENYPGITGTITIMNNGDLLPPE